MADGQTRGAFSLLVCLIGLALLVFWPAFEAAAVQTIALRGSSPSAGEAATFQNFSLASLNNRGQVAFAAQLTGGAVTTANDFGYWIAADGGFQSVVREGAGAPGLPAGTVFGNQSSLFTAQVPLNEAGDIAVGMPATQTSGLWVGNHDSFTLLAAQASEAPGAENGAGFTSLAGARATLNRRGDVAFNASLNAAPYTTINSVNYHDGLWILNRSGPVASVLAAMDAPALGEEAQYYGFQTFTFPALNRNGQAAFSASHKLTPASSTNGWALWMASNAGVELRGVSGQPFPEIGPNATLNFISAAGISSAGSVAGEATFSNPGGTPSSGTAIVVADADGIALAAYTGAPAPGTGGHVFRATFYDPSMSSRGQIAFYGSEWDGVNFGTEKSGIWAGVPDDLRLVVLQGMAAPGANATFSSFIRDTPAINRFGQVAWSGAIIDTQSSATSTSLWATDLNGQLTKIARVGDGLEVAPGDVRTISTLSMLTEHGDDDGRPRGLNDLGQIAFGASFTNGTNGVFVSNAVAHLPGDYNHDHVVDTADYIVWRKALSTQNLVADGDRDGVVGAGDYEIMREFFGLTLPVVVGGSAVTLVPEPASIVLGLIAIAVFCARRRGLRCV